MVYKQTMTTHIDPAAYTPLLATIAKGESNGNYNAHFGNVTNTTIRFTDMSVAEVLQWQAQYVQNGSPSSAVGKYQIIRSTLAGLADQLGIAPDARFDETLQDRMAIALLERRGALDYLGRKLTREQFAANLAKEWAALPRVIGERPEESYYAHDGLNKSHIGVSEVFEALAALDSKAAAL
jgi:muramidase (phage lysozyme)